MPIQSAYPSVTSVLSTDLILAYRAGVGTINIPASLLVGGETYDVAMNYLATPPASSVFLSFIAVREFSIPSGFTLSKAWFVTAPTNQVQLTVSHAGTQIGTITWQANANSGVFAGAGVTGIAAGDLLEISSGGNLYAAADLVLTLAGTIP